MIALPATAQTSPSTSFTIAGTWTYTVPAGVYFVRVRAAGAGGGGGGSDASGAGGAGGAGAAITIVLRVTPGQVLSGVVGGGGASGFTGGNPVQCVGGGLASSFGGGGNGANANCASGGYSGGGGAGGGASTVALAGTILAQAGGGGGGSGGGWNTPGAAGVNAPATIVQSGGCTVLGSGAAGTVFNLDGGAAAGGGGGFPGGTSGAGSADNGGTAATGGGLQRGGGAGGNCNSTSTAIISATTSGAGGAGAPGIAVVTNSTTGARGNAGSVTVTLLPSVIISKTSTGSVGSFGFTGTNGVANQTLTTVTAGTAISGTPQLLTSVTASTVITESAASGFSLASISCSNLGSGGTATVSLASRSVTLNGAAVAPGVAVICTFTNATALTIVKRSTPVWDPVNGTINPKHIPGGQVRYCLRVSNPATSPAATSAVITDSLPSGVSFVPGSLFINGTASGATCNTGALTALGRTTLATGGGPSGAPGGSFSAGAITAALGTINPGATVTVYFDVVLP